MISTEFFCFQYEAFQRIAMHVDEVRCDRHVGMIRLRSPNVRGQADTYCVKGRECVDLDELSIDYQLLVEVLDVPCRGLARTCL